MTDQEIRNSWTALAEDIMEGEANYRDVPLYSLWIQVQESVRWNGKPPEDF